MGIFDRIRNIFRANLNDALTRTEDPEKLLDQMIADWSQDLVRVKQAAASAIAAEKRLQAEYDQRRQAVDTWQRRAELAVDKGDDNLARQALARKLQYQQEANQLEESLNAQESTLDQLRNSVQTLENRLQEAVLKRNQLVARYRSAEAMKTLQQEMSRTGGGSEALAQLEQRTNQAEAQAAAYHELSGDSLEERFARLEAGSADNVNDELAALKKQRLLGEGNQSG
ncbi:MAG TPA: PspA/IM30 family protein [Chloroflexota bacterium]|nr:PspA/IM30 family protein [Chloroflexota bacterium]